MHVNDMVPNSMKLHEENQQLRRMIDSLKEDLRDQFANTALQGMVALWAGNSGMTVGELAEDAYRVADAMLRARDGREG